MNSETLQLVSSLLDVFWGSYPEIDRRRYIQTNFSHFHSRLPLTTAHQYFILLETCIYISLIYLKRLIFCSSNSLVFSELENYLLSTITYHIQSDHKITRGILSPLAVNLLGKIYYINI